MRAKIRTHQEAIGQVPKMGSKGGSGCEEGDRGWGDKWVVPEQWARRKRRQMRETDASGRNRAWGRVQRQIRTMNKVWWRSSERDDPDRNGHRRKKEARWQSKEELKNS